MRIYLVPVQQKAIHEPPNDTHARRNLGLPLRGGDLHLAVHSNCVAQQHRPLLVQAVVRGMVVRDAYDAFDSAQVLRLCQSSCGNGMGKEWEGGWWCTISYAGMCLSGGWGRTGAEYSERVSEVVPSV